LADSFDAYRYISYLRSRWRWIAASGATAVLIAAIVSAGMTRQYTATARIVIDFPAGSDLRGSIAISPIYLESLKTYESFASSDSLFRKAIDKFSLRGQAGLGPVESLKTRVLKVALVHNTRILEISVTLPDARKAQAVAQFVAESTVELNRSLGASGDQDLIRGVEQQASDTRARLGETETAWARLLVREPVDELRAEMDNAARLRAVVAQELANAEVELADVVERQKHAPAAEQESLGNEQSTVRARMEQMRRQMETIDRRTAEQEKLLAERLAHRDALETQRKADQAGLAAMENRLRDARGEAGRRGERLVIIDPGIVPERPSSPNVALNLAAALLLGLVLPLLYLTVEMSFRERQG
jgi:capsule polysaccharide export protein KpsE/RkpR